MGHIQRRLGVAGLAFAVSFLPASAGATDYYVSKKGNDLNAGTSEGSPWKTLAKVSALTYQPGDVIHLERAVVAIPANRTWAETLVLRGEGTPMSPITVTTYGNGMRPRIAPGTIDSTGIRIEGGGGWKIMGLEVANARWGIDLKYDLVTDRNFIWLEDLYIHNITGFNSTPGKFNFMSSAIVLRHWTDDPNRPTFLHDLTIKDVTIEGADFGFWTGSICEGTLPGGGGDRCDGDGFSRTGLWAYLDGFSFDRISVANGRQVGFSMVFVKNGSMTNSTIYNVGSGGWQYGTAGAVLAWSSNVVLDGLNIYYVSRGGGYDGCGFDFEGGNENPIYRNSEIYYTDGAGICVFDNGNNAGPNHNMLLENMQVSWFGHDPGNVPPVNHQQAIFLANSDPDPASQHTGRFRTSHFNNGFNRPFIGVYQQSPPAHDPSTPFWLDNCCEQSVNISAGKNTAATSSLDGAHGPEKAIDGQAATFWQAGAAAPQEWWIDLFASYAVTRVELKFNSSAHWPFVVEGTTDLQTWATLRDFSNGFDGDFVSFKATGSHHWVRVRFLGGSPTPTLQEVTLFGHP